MIFLQQIRAKIVAQMDSMVPMHSRPESSDGSESAVLARAMSVIRRPRVLREHYPLVGQRHLLSDPVKQPRPQLLLQMLDLYGHGRLGIPSFSAARLKLFSCATSMKVTISRNSIQSTCLTRIKPETFMIKFCPQKTAQNQRCRYSGIVGKQLHSKEIYALSSITRNTENKNKCSWPEIVIFFAAV